MAEEELRFNCSFRWHVSVDDDIELEIANTPKGQVIRATPKDRADTIAVAFDVHEHVVLVKNMGPNIAKSEWSLRLAPTIEIIIVKSEVDLTLQCDPQSNIFPVDLAVPAARAADGTSSGATCLAVSPIPFVEQQTSRLQFKPIDAVRDGDGSVKP